MKSYDNYKSSGLEWIPKIPSTWSAVPLKYILKYNVGFTPPSGNSEYYGGENVWVTIADLKNKFVVESNEKVSDLAISKFSPSITIKNSLLFSFKLSIGKVAFAGKNLYTNEAIISFLPSSEYDLKFYYYSLGFMLEQNANENIYGAKILNQELIRNSKLLSPPLAEQKAIANYLDCKTQSIDDLIENKQKLIELLKEEIATIINQAVTKGLNSKVKLKSSGIEWLGEIPEHWEIKKLKYQAHLKSGENIVSEQISPEAEYPVYGGNGLRGYFNKYTHDGDYVLIGRQGALCGNINYAEKKFWASEHAIVCTLLADSNIIWFGELLRVMNLNQYSQSAAQPGISVEKIQNLSIPIPPLVEQNLIGKSIKSENNRILILIDKFEKEIELLKEYRLTLINEVVTGKIKVI